MISMLSACTVGQRTALPPVIDNTSQAPAAAGGDGDVQAFPLLQQDGDSYSLEPLEGTDPVPLPDGSISPSTPQPRQSNNAVIALLDRADQYGQAGQNDAAAIPLSGRCASSHAMPGYGASLQPSGYSRVNQNRQNSWRLNPTPCHSITGSCRLKTGAS